jgi:ABC-type spermidine/putrescine transport system permease subunit II
MTVRLVRKAALRGIGIVGLLVRIVVVVFLIGPAVTVAVLSFTNDTILIFPPRSWGLGLYSSFFHSSSWLDAVWTSFEIAIPAAAIALAVATPAAYGLARSRVPARGVVRSFALAPLIIPGVAYAVAIYSYYAEFHLIDTTIGVILVHATLGVPFVTLIVGASFINIAPELEHVAMTLGATRQRAAFDTSIRLALPSMAAAYVFAFLASFDEGVIVQFIAGPGQTTLPKAIYDSVRTGLDPRILAIATLLMLLTAVLLVVAFRARRPRAAT